MDQVLPRGWKVGPMGNNLTGMAGSSSAKGHGDEANPQGRIRPDEDNQSDTALG